MMCTNVSSKPNCGKDDEKIMFFCNQQEYHCNVPELWSQTLALPRHISMKTADRQGDNFAGLRRPPWIGLTSCQECEHSSLGGQNDLLWWFCPPVKPVVSDPQCYVFKIGRAGSPAKMQYIFCQWNYIAQWFCCLNWVAQWWRGHCCLIPRGFLVQTPPGWVFSCSPCACKGFFQVQLPLKILSKQIGAVDAYSQFSVTSVKLVG